MMSRTQVLMVLLLSLVVNQLVAARSLAKHGADGGGSGGPGSSDGGGSGGSGDMDNDRSNVTCSASSNGIVLKSESQTDTTRDRIEIDISISGEGPGPAKSLQARLRAYSRVSGSGNGGGGNGGAQAQIDFRVKFTQLVEYAEVDGVAGFSGNDTVGTVLNLGNQVYTYSVLADQTIGSSAVKVVRAASSQFTITAKMGSALFNDSGVFALTNSMKVDVDIQNFAYTLGSQARLALVVGVVSEKTRIKTQQRDDDQTHVESERLNVRSNSAAGPVDAYFSWAKTVDVTSPAQTVAVIASQFKLVDNDQDDGDDFDHNEITYSFDAEVPATVHWDPVVGMGLSSSAVSVSVSLAASLALLLAVAWNALML